MTNLIEDMRVATRHEIGRLEEFLAALESKRPQPVKRRKRRKTVTMDAVRDYANTMGRVTPAIIAARFDVSYATAARKLDQLAEKGILNVTGHRPRVYESAYADQGAKVTPLRGQRRRRRRRAS